MLAQPLPKLPVENGYLYITNDFDGIYDFELVKNLRICQRGDNYVHFSKYWYNLLMLIELSCMSQQQFSVLKLLFQKQNTCLVKLFFFY